MANKLIEELIIKVKQQGAKPTEKSLKRVADQLEDSAAGAELLQEQLDKLPRMLQLIEKKAFNASKQMKKVNMSIGSNAVTASLNSIDDGITSIISAITELNEDANQNTRAITSHFDALANSLGADLDRVQDGLIDVAGEAKKTGEALESVGKGASKARRPLANQNRQGRNSVRTFSDIAKVAGPLPLIYANIAANAFALSEAFRLISEGEQINRLEQVGVIMGSQVGVAVQTTARHMQELTGNTLSYAESLRQAAAVSAYGFDDTQMEQLTLAARRASIALGVDMQDALNRVIKGTSKLEIELLDELGITTKLTTAYEKYAAQIGVSAKSLNAYQQRAALVNEINAQSVQKFGVLNELVGQGQPWEQFGANASTEIDKFLQNIAKSTAAIAKFMNQFYDAADAVEEPTIRSKELVDVLNQADKIGARGGIAGALIGMQNYRKELISTLPELQKQLDALGVDAWGGVGSGIKEQIRNTKTAIQDLTNAIEEAPDLGVRSLQKLTDAYKAVSIAANSSVTSYRTVLGQMKGQTQSYNKLYNDINDVVKAYESLKAAEVSSNALTSAVKRLGFENAEAMYKARELAKAYRDLKKEEMQLSATTQSYRLQGVIKNTDAQDVEIQILKEKDSLYNRLEISAQKLNLSESELAQIHAQRLQVTTRLLEIDKERQNIQAKQVQGAAYMTGVTSGIGMSDREVQQLQVSERADMFKTSMSDITSQVAGLEQMTNSFQTLALAAANFGEVGSSALQMTSVGLQGFAGMLRMVSNSAVSNIDAQISMEQKRDGKSRESQEKIKQLEAKKIKVQQDAAKKQILISTAVATMNAAANPWPMPAIPLMAAAALAGGLAYSQASSAASNQLAGLDAGAATRNASLTMGERQNTVDVSSQATKGELSYIRGESGMGSIASFTPRAEGGRMTPGMSFIVGENGPEVVTPLEPMQSVSNDEATKAANGNGGGFVFSPNIQAMDAQSIIDRSDDIFEAFKIAADEQGINIYNLK